MVEANKLLEVVDPVGRGGVVGMFVALQPKGSMFESTSSRRVETLSKSSPSRAIALCIGVKL